MVAPLCSLIGGSSRFISSFLLPLSFFIYTLCFRIILLIYLAVDITPIMSSSSLSFFSSAVDICLRVIENPLRFKSALSSCWVRVSFLITSVAAVSFFYAVLQMKKSDGNFWLDILMRFKGVFVDLWGSKISSLERGTLSASLFINNFNHILTYW